LKLVAPLSQPTNYWRTPVEIGEHGFGSAKEHDYASVIASDAAVYFVAIDTPNAITATEADRDVQADRGGLRVASRT
jgi:hypothetical protein